MTIVSVGVACGGSRKNGHHGQNHGESLLHLATCNSKDVVPDAVAGFIFSQRDAKLSGRFEEVAKGDEGLRRTLALAVIEGICAQQPLGVRAHEFGTSVTWVRLVLVRLVSVGDIVVGTQYAPRKNATYLRNMYSPRGNVRAKDRGSTTVQRETRCVPNLNPSRCRRMLICWTK